MNTSNNDTSETRHDVKKENIMTKIAIFFVKKVSNCFWEVADHWSYKSEKIAKFYNKFIGEEYKIEYASCGIAQCMHVLHIGCGAYPLTELVLAQVCPGTIVGIDRNQQTVKQATEVIQKKKLEHKITIEYGDGLTYPVETFDAIIVSSCSLPKVKILEHLFTKANPSTVIVAREVDIATKNILKCIEAHRDIILGKRVRHNPFPFFKPIGWTTFCLKKK